MTDPIRDDPRDDNIGLQDVRDDSEPDWDENAAAEAREGQYTAWELIEPAAQGSWRDRYDTREEYEDSR